MTKQAEIVQLNDRDHVRLRKGMYIPNINYSVFEIVDNSVDEFIAGHGSEIYVSIYPDRTITVLDLGRGLPIGVSKDDPTKTQAEVALGSLKSGGKFGGEGSYDVKTGGLNGVGSSAINFLSEYMEAIIYKEGKKYGLRFDKGEITQKLFEIGSIEEGEPTQGTFIALKPDVEIWKDDDDLDLTAISSRMKQLTYLNPGLTIHVDIDYSEKQIKETHYNPEGLKTYLEDLSKNKELLTNIWQTDISIDGIDISLALTYTNAYTETIYAYTNNVLNAQGGSHLTGLKEGISRSLISYYDETSSNKSKVNISSEDTREGLISVMSIKVKDPNFDGQGKAKLNMPKVRTAVRKATEEFMTEQLDKSPEEAKIILAKVLQAQKAREAAKRAREASRTMKGMAVSKVEKLTKCISKNPEEISLWLVEGKA